MLQIPPVGVGQGGLDGRYQAFALLENRNWHRFVSVRHPASRPRIRAGKGGHRLSLHGLMEIGGIILLDHLVSDQLLGLLEAAPSGRFVVLSRLRSMPIRDQRLRDLGRDAGDDDRRPHEPRRLDRLQEMIGHLRIDDRHAGDVDDHGLGAIGPDRAQ